MKASQEEEDTPSEDIAEVMEEVEIWVNQQPETSNRPIRLAYDSLRRYQRLKDEKEKHISKIKDLSRTLRHRERNTEQDRQMAKNVEEGLLAKIQDMEAEHEKKLSEANEMVEQLRVELGRSQFKSNPLPPPPEPLPLDRFPSFVRSAARANITAEATSGPPNGRYDGSQPHPHVSSDSLGRYMNGYPHYFPDVPVEKGQLTADHRGQVLGYSLSAGANIEPYTTTTHRTRSEVVPGAPPAERVVPRKAKWDDASLDYIVTPEDNRRRSDRRVTTDGAGFRAMAASHARASSSAHGQHSEPSSATRDPSAPAAAYVNGYETGFGSGYTYAREFVSNPVQQPVRHSHSRGDRSHEDSGMGGLGLSVVPGPTPQTYIPAGTTTRPMRAQRSVTTSSIESRQFSLLSHPSTSGPDAEHGPSGDRRGHSLTDGQSVSSWGTLSDTRRSLNTDGSSVADLGLVGFHVGNGHGGGAAGAQESNLSSLSTPLRLAHPEDVGDDVSGTDGDDDRNTPRTNYRAQLYPADFIHGAVQSSSMGSHSSSAHPPHLDSSHHQSRYVSDPETSYTQETIRGRRRSHRTDQQQNPITTRRPSSSFDPTQQQQVPEHFSRLVVSDTESSAPNANAGSGNALALTFDHGSPADSRVPHISAPTPIVSTRNALRSWTTTFNAR